MYRESVKAENALVGVGVHTAGGAGVSSYSQSSTSPGSKVLGLTSGSSEFTIVLASHQGNENKQIDWLSGTTQTALLAWSTIGSPLPPPTSRPLSTAKSDSFRSRLSIQGAIITSCDILATTVLPWAVPRHSRH